MKCNNLKYGVLAVVLAMGVSACDNFLDRPTIDNYNTSNYYETDDQCISGVNYLYNSPWYDFQRGFIKVGEVLSGNYYWGSSPYLTFTVNGTDQDLVNMSYSLWAVIGHANTVYDNIKGSPASQAVKNQCMGECLTWKALAYFYLVRSFGDVPIIHNNTDELVNGSYNDKYKVQKADVYEYIIMTLEKAMELLPESSDPGRIDYYCAEGLLAKVYLTRAGISGSLNGDDLAKAASYAKDVIDNSGRQLLDNYSDVFRLANNESEESLIAWRWTAEGNTWTSQNTLQSDLAIDGFDEFGDCWGGWSGLSVDLQEAFGVKLLEQSPDSWINATDTRCQATMFLPGCTYPYFWQDKGGFDYLRFIYDDTYNAAATGTLQSATGSNTVKHLYGNAQDHVAGVGHSAAYMKNSLATHILRLSDVYLIYAEAINEVQGSYIVPTWDGQSSWTITRDVNELKRGMQPIRIRAGIPDLPEEIYQDVNKFRIKLKRERQIELFAESHRYFDLRRWCDADEEEPRHVYGCNIYCREDQYQLFHTPVETPSLPSIFTTKMWFWPINHTELQRNIELSQNPGWTDAE